MFFSSIRVWRKIESVGGVGVWNLEQSRARIERNFPALEVDRKRSEHAKATVYNYTKCFCVLTLFCQFLSSKERKTEWRGKYKYLPKFGKLHIKKSGFGKIKRGKNSELNQIWKNREIPIKGKTMDLLIHIHPPSYSSTILYNY